MMAGRLIKDFAKFSRERDKGNFSISQESLDREIRNLEFRKLISCWPQLRKYFEKFPRERYKGEHQEIFRNRCIPTIHFNVHILPIKYIYEMHISSLDS